MSSIDTASFSDDVTEDQPCGENLEYDPEFIRLEQLARGKPEQQIGDVIEPGEPPNWREVRKAAEGLLARTRDLRVLVYLIRALLNTEGFHGLAEGLRLTRALLEKYWDHIHPQLDPDDDNDPTERINILLSLCDQGTVLNAIQQAPMVASRAMGNFSLRDLGAATGKIAAAAREEDPPSLNAIDAAFSDAGEEAVQATLDDLGSAIESVDAMEAFVTDQVGVANAPSFDPLRSLLREVQHAVGQRAGAGGEALAAEEAVAGEEGGSAAPIRGGVPGSISNTGDVVAVLKQVCAYYRQNEPSSPIPILIERAMRLVGKDFMEVLNDLAPDGLSQMEVIRGPIKENE